MIVRVFNAAGIEASHRNLDELRAGTIDGVPHSLLENDDWSSPVGEPLRALPARGFLSRWELGLWLWQQLEGRIDDRLLLTTDGLWTWLAFALMDLLCPKVDGVRKFGEDARYILDRSNRRRWYRHLLAGPYLLVRAHTGNPARLRSILAGPPNKPGNMYEQLAGRKELITSGAVAEVATRLYWNAD